jgi:hypothetical protein
LLEYADNIDEEPYERDQMLARAQVYATLAVVTALREVADATIQADGETARAITGTAQIAELLAEISQAIAHNH